MFILNGVLLLFFYIKRPPPIPHPFTNAREREREREREITKKRAISSQ
jgi:hypothetical protein